MNLPQEKKDAILNAAFAAFGKMGYKKASAKDIADAAGISKAMLFRYFGSKKSLYLYLINLAADEMIQEVEARFKENVTDFFDRITLATEIKLSMMSKHPPMLQFFYSVYLEQDPEVAADIQAFMVRMYQYRDTLAISGLDTSKFKPGVDPILVLNILTRFTEGYINAAPNTPTLDIDAILTEFNACLKLMRDNFYNPEH